MTQPGTENASVEHSGSNPLSSILPLNQAFSICSIEKIPAGSGQSSLDRVEAVRETGVGGQIQRLVGEAELPREWVVDVLVPLSVERSCGRQGCGGALLRSSSSPPDRFRPQRGARHGRNQRARSKTQELDISGFGESSRHRPVMHQSLAPATGIP